MICFLTCNTRKKVFFHSILNKLLHEKTGKSGLVMISFTLSLQLQVIFMILDCTLSSQNICFPSRQLGCQISERLSGFFFLFQSIDQQKQIISDVK